MKTLRTPNQSYPLLFVLCAIVVCTVLCSTCAARVPPMSRTELEKALNDMEEDVTSIHLVASNHNELDAVFLRYDEDNERLWFKTNGGHQTSISLMKIESVSANIAEVSHTSIWSIKHPKSGHSLSWIGAVLEFVGGWIAALSPNSR